MTTSNLKDIFLNCLPKIFLNTFNDSFDKTEQSFHKGLLKSSEGYSDYSHPIVKWGYFVDPEKYQYQVSSNSKKKRTFYEEQGNRQIKSRNKHISSKNTPVINEMKEINYKLPHVDSITKNNKSYKNLFHYSNDNNLKVD